MCQKFQTILPYFLIIAVSSLPRLPCLFGEFVFDDLPAVLWNEDALGETHWKEIFRHDFWGAELQDDDSHLSYRPITTLTFRLHKFDAFYFHLTNLLLHVGNSILIYGLLKDLLKPPCLSIFVALLFSAHPVNSEAICSIVGRADLLWSFFALIAIRCELVMFSFVYFIFKKYFSDFPQNYVMVLVLTSLSLLSKEHGILIIPMLLAIQWTDKGFKIIKEKITFLYIVTFMGFVYIRMLLVDFKTPKFQEADNPPAFMSQMWQRSLNFQYIYGLNFWILLCPHWLCHDWAMDCVAMITDLQDARILLIIITWASLLFMVWKKENHLGLALAILPFIPSSNILVVVGFVIAERNLYFCVLGFSILICQGSEKLFRSRSKWLLGILILLFSLKSLHRSFDWHSEESLYKSGLSVCPKNAKIYHNLGKITSDPMMSMAYYKKAVEIRPNYEQPWVNLGVKYENLFELEKAESCYNQAIKANPKFSVAWCNLGNVQAMQSKVLQAEDSYVTGLRLEPEYSECRVNLARLYMQNGEYEAARKQIKLAYSNE